MQQALAGDSPACSRHLLETGMLLPVAPTLMAGTFLLVTQLPQDLKGAASRMSMQLSTASEWTRTQTCCSQKSAQLQCLL